MKLITCSDIHQLPSKWKLVIEACEEEKPDVLVVAGDICSHHNGIEGELDYFKHILRYAQKIKDLGVEIVLTLGNDDNQLLIPQMEQADADGLWHYVSDKKAVIDGYEFIGMPYVPDYPFGYKFWCHPEFPEMLRICEVQYGPCIINEHNKICKIASFNEYFKAKQSIWDALVDRAEKIDDMSKSIWLIHAPPARMALDVCASGHKPGSEAVLKFVSEYQPLLTVHGHIHEAPEYNGKQWKRRENHTLCVQNGQIDRELFYSVLVIEDGQVKSAWHSVYGEAKVV
jgi:Icc-related predicted phosphoesterase